MVESNIFETYDYETITVADSAIGLTAATIAPSNSSNPIKVFMTLETAQIRFRTDGTDPTSGEGHLLEIGQSMSIDSFKDLGRFMAIRTGATSGVLKVSYQRR